MGTPYKMKGHTLPGPNQASPAKQKAAGKIDKGLKQLHSIKGTIDELTGTAHMKRAMNQPITTTASGGLTKKEEMGGGAR